MKEVSQARSRRVGALGLMLLAAIAMALSVTATPTQPASAQATVIHCDRVLNVTTWNQQLSAVNTNDVLCYQFSGAQLSAEMQRLNAPALIELQVTRGSFDLYAFVAPAATSNLADQLNEDPILAGGGWRSYPYLNVSPANNYVIAVAPATEARGNYRLRVRVAPGAPVAQPTSQPVGPTNVFPTTTNAPCSRYAFSLAALCIDPYPVAPNGSISVLWRIANFRYGELDQGDGQGFKGPIASEQRVVVPNITTPRVIRLRWVDTAGRQFIDSILVQVGQPTDTAAISPTVNPNFFPCSRAGIGISNLCVEQPFPVQRGTSAFVVWRIADFRYGEFDNGNGQGFKGPISREQRVEVPNVTGPRLIRLRWIDSNNLWREDDFVIQVVDGVATPIP